jgi:hypothetical protein
MRYGNYDSWKLATPWDDEPEMPEVYKTKKYEFFTHDENLANEFDKKMVKLEMKKVPESYDTKEEYYEELAYELADDLGLEYNKEGVYKYLSEKEYDEYLDAVENGYKGSYKGLSYRHHYAKSWRK